MVITLILIFYKQVFRILTVVNIVNWPTCFYLCDNLRKIGYCIFDFILLLKCSKPYSKRYVYFEWYVCNLVIEILCLFLIQHLIKQKKNLQKVRSAFLSRGGTKRNFLCVTIALLLQQRKLIVHEGCISQKRQQSEHIFP